MARKKENKIEINREWMTEAEAAAYLKTSLQNLKDMRYKPRVLKSGIMEKPPVYRLGGDYRYERHELDQWLLNQRVR